MTEFVTNIIQNSLSGFVAGAITSVGGYAGTAASGIGNLVDERGQAVGDGITRKFDGWGQAVAAYGNSVKSATAPNNSPSSGVPKPKSSLAQKPVSAKALPARDKKLLLSAPVAKKGTYASTVAPYKAQVVSRSAAPSTIASTRTAKPTTRPVLAKAKSDQSVPSATKTAQLPKTSTGPAGLSKARSVGGKVVPQRRSLPASKGRGSSSPPKAKASAGYKGPLGDVGGGQMKSKGYDGPLNLSSLGNSGSKSGAGKAASVAGSKSGNSGYKGPLDLRGLGK